MTTIDQIRELLHKYPEGRVYFDEPVKVKASPHHELFRCYGVSIDNTDIYLMDPDEKWHGPLEENQVNANLVIASLYQRLKGLQCSK